MKKFLNWRYALAPAALALLVASCSEQTRHPAAPGVDGPLGPPSFLAGVAGNGAGKCLVADVVDYYGAGPVNCTANDISIATTEVSEYSFTGAPGSFIQLAPGDSISCSVGQHIFVNTSAILENSAQERYDIGIWINTGLVPGDTSALNGSTCNHYNVLNNSPGATDLDNDSCGDMLQGSLATVPLDVLELVCNDPDGNSKLEIKGCVAWDNSTTGQAIDHACPVTDNRQNLPGTHPTLRESFVWGTLPNTPAKCNCEPFELPVKILGSLQLVKRVVNDNGGTAAVGAFGITTDAGTPVFGSAVVSGSTSTYTSQAMPVEPGAYTLRENDIAGYSEGTWSCTGATANPTSISAGSVTVPSGGAVVCTIINNDDPGTLTLVKNIVNDNGGTAGVAAFNISTSAGTPVFGSAVVNGTTSTYTSQAMSTNAGSKTLIEANVAGYAEGSWSCTPTTQTSSTFSAGSVVVGNGVAVTCTITNNDSPGSLTLVKNIVNDNGGTAVVGAFNISTSAGTPVFGSAVVNGTTSTYTSQAMGTDAGSKTLIEANVAGYTEGSWSCTPTAQTSSTFSAGSVTIANGVDVTCTITNNDDPGTLTLVKNIVNDNGGTAGVAAFNISTSAGTPVFGSAVVNGTTSTYTSQAMSTNAGSKTLIEANVAGYAEGSWSCTPTTQTSSTFSAGSVVVGNGVAVTCTITNNDSPGSLTLVKNIVNDNGGTAVVGAFNISTSAGTPVFGSAVVNGTTSTYTSQAMGTDAGSKTLIEANVAGYTEGSWSCTPTAQTSSTFSAGSVVVGNGIDVTCTITNNDDPGNLILIKNVVNDNGGTLGVAAFNISTSAGTPVFGSAVVNGTTSTYTSQSMATNAGSKTLVEANVAGYTEGGWSCSPTAETSSTFSAGSVVVGNGVTVTCTITNNDQPATLIVRKIVIGDGATFDFTGTGGMTSPFTLTPPSDGIDSVVFNNLNAGVKTVTEGAESGYTLTDLGCSNQAEGTYDPALTSTVSTTVGNGVTVTCTFINEQVVGETTRTQGFWQTHLSLAVAVWFGGEAGGHTFDGVSDNLLCGRAIDSTAELMAAFWSNIAKTSTGAKRSAIDQARMRLLQQLIAAELNHEAFGSSPSGSISISLAEQYFCTGTIEQINDAHSQMAAFNEGGDAGEFTPGVSAQAKAAKTAAGTALAFWDVLPAGI